MPKPKVKEIKKETSATRGKICSCCGERKTKNSYYVSWSYINNNDNLMSICKDCTLKTFDEYESKFNNIKKSIYYTCRKLDYPFLTSTWKSAENNSQAKGWHIFASYMKDINSFSKTHSKVKCFDDGETVFSEDITIDPEMYKNDIKISGDMKKKWGNIPQGDIMSLEYEYIEWCQRYDVSTKAMETLVQEICYLQLQIKKKRECGESTSKELKDLQDLMNSAALKPIQETASMGTENNTIGTWIKKFENEKPIPEPDPELQDVDGLMKYIRIWFLGHLCKMMGLQNEYSKEYEEEMIKHTIDINFENSFDSTYEGVDDYGVDE